MGDLEFGVLASGALDHDRPGDQVVPAAAAGVEEHPDIADVEDDPGNPVAEQPQERAAELLGSVLARI